MAYSTQEGRTQILDDTAQAAAELGRAIAALGEAYEHLDEQTAELMEQRLFRPLQGAYSQLNRTRAEFAQRTTLVAREVTPALTRAPEGPRESLEHAADAISDADQMLADLQDTLLPVEVGDQPLRAGLSAVRNAIGRLPELCDEMVRTVGR
jgi:hypothetical protein